MIKAIHGYGSHGVGGEIKRNLSQWLRRAKSMRFISDFVKGEEWPASEKAKKIKSVCSFFIVFV